MSPAEAVAVVGLTPERWETVLVALGIVVFAAGLMIAERF